MAAPPTVRSAGGDPRIGSYFVGRDMERLARHFTAAMIMVTCDGVTVGGLRSMARVHRGVRNTAGDPITGDIYDRTVNLLVEVLASHGVPDEAINDLARVVNPLREAIVATR